MFRNTLRTPGFESDLKQLKKRYQSPDGDIDILTKALFSWFCVEQKAGQSCNDNFVLMSGYAPPHGDCFLYKVRHMACRAMKGKGNRTGLRVIVAYWPGSDTCEFLQIYLKSDSALENQNRIRNYLKTVQR